MQNWSFISLNATTPYMPHLHQILGLKIFLASHINFNLYTFNCDWVEAIHKKQSFRWYELSVRFVNHFASFCDENSLDLLCPAPEP